MKFGPAGMGSMKEVEMAQSNIPTSLEKALKCESIGTWTFYGAVTGHDWFNEPLLAMGEIHPFKFTFKNRDQIYELVKKLKRHYQQYYEPEEKPRQYYDPHFDKIDAAKSGKLKEQKKAIRDLLTAIVLD
jgi:hypothetical protein